jgi:hypothetical protein
MVALTLIGIYRLKVRVALEKREAGTSVKGVKRDEKSSLLKVHKRFSQMMQ